MSKTTSNHSWADCSKSRGEQAVVVPSKFQSISAFQPLLYKMLFSGFKVSVPQNELVLRGSRDPLDSAL